MYSRKVKNAAFVLEGLNSVSTTLYFNYLFFHMRAEFGFTNQGNLFLCAVNGAVYMAMAWFGGRVGQRRGYFTALGTGFTVMGVAMLVASRVRSVEGCFAAMVLWTLGMCFTWPNLEAVVSERESPLRLQRLLGIYNVVWAVSSGLANFVGGALLEKLGRESIFLVPAGLHVVQLVILAWMRKTASPARKGDEEPAVSSVGLSPEPERWRGSVPPETFLKMAWVANPFAYVAINGLIPVIPRLAERFELSPMFAGFVCSIWFFARAAAFLLLWHWTAWHYRFRWLAGSYVAVALSFATLLASTRLWMLVAAQLVFGAGVALLYYASLFYSMDVGETKGEHGGIHETALGAGVFAGPALGAASLRFFPGSPNMNAWAVTLLLMGGFACLVVLRQRGRAKVRSAG